MDDVLIERHDGWRRLILNRPSKLNAVNADMLPRLLAAIKTMFAAVPGNTLHQQLDLEARLQGEAGRSADFAEGVRAFQEKRAPRFR